MFLRRPQLGLRLTLLALLSIALMVFDKTQGHVNYLRSSLLLLISPIQYVIDLPFTLTDYAVDQLRSRNVLHQENQQLKTERLLLRAQTQKLAALEQENLRLKTLLKSSDRVGDHVLIATLLRLDPDPYSHRLVLDKGSQEGVYIGQPILDAYGIMGQIIEVSRFTSVALLITDISHALPVQNNRNGVRSIGVGTGDLHELLLSHVTNTADFEIGDLLVTSGLGRRFPAGYPVGVITQITTEPGELFLHIKVRPSANLDKSREVLLIWPDIDQIEKK
jgi:rod shape-determining protein MreC